MGEGLDDELEKNGGRVRDNYEDVPNSDPALRKAARAEEAAKKKKFAFVLRDRICNKFRLAYVEDRFFFYETNAMGGGYWKECPDRAIYTEIGAEAGEAYRLTLRNECVELIKNRVAHSLSFFEHRNHHLVNCLNGTLDLLEMKLRPASADDRLRTILPVQYQPGVVSSLWIRALGEIFEGDDDKIDILQRFLGYCLMPSCKEEKFLLMVGMGANGKGVISDTIQSVFGADNCTSIGLERFSSTHYSGMLFGKMLNLSTESNTKIANWSEAFKQAVSGEVMVSDDKYKSRFLFRPTAKHIISINERPYIEDKSDGLSRRMIPLEMNKQFFEGAADKDLKAKLVKERAGVLNWVISGHKAYLERGLEVTDATRDMVAELRRESNSVLSFMDDVAERLAPFECTTKEAYQAYKDYCSEYGFKSYSVKKFVQTILSNFPGIERARFGEDRKRGFVGFKVPVVVT